MQTKNERFLINYFFSSDFTILILGFLSFLQGFTISILNFSSIVFKNFFLIFPTPTSAEFKHSIFWNDFLIFRALFIAGLMKVAFFRNSRAEVFCKKGVLRNFVKVAVAASGNTKPGRFLLLISVFLYLFDDPATEPSNLTSHFSESFLKFQSSRDKGKHHNFLSDKYGI